MPVCLRSVKFFRVRMQCCVVLVSIVFIRKYVIPHSAAVGQIPLHRARLSAFGQIRLCLRAMLRRFVEYWVPQLKDKRAVKNDVFSDLKNVQSAHENLKRTKRFNL